LAWAHRVAREFRKVLSDTDLQISSGTPYINEYGVPGCRFEGIYKYRDFYISQNRTMEIEDVYLPEKIAKLVLKDEYIALSRWPIYTNRWYGKGLCVEAWFGGRWFQVFTPDNERQPDDKFTGLIQEISSSSHD
jgi:hypothetical protein